MRGLTRTYMHAVRWFRGVARARGPASGMPIALASNILMTHSTHAMLSIAAASCLAACAGASTPRATTTHAATPRAWHFSSSATAGHEVPQAPPSLFVHVDRVSDPAHKLPPRADAHVTGAVQQALTSSDFSTAWPGELPKSAELELRGSRAFIVAATVHEVKIDRAGRRARIACKVGIRVSPWYGVDGGEKWEGTNTATATGSAQVSTKSDETEQGVQDCVSEVAQTVVAKRIVPFLRVAAE